MGLYRCLLLWHFFFFFIVFFLVVPQTTLAAGPYLGAPYLTCMHNTTNGTSLSSTFKHNLNAALQNLTSLSAKGTKYAITSAGSGDDTVYAMFQCRGDQTTLLCSECLDNATVRLPQRDCPASIGARIQLDGCYLRYDNKSFFTPDFTSAVGYCYSKSSDPVVLAAISSLVQNVTTQAPEKGGFASASAEGEYAAAQCLGYLNKSECSQCLSTIPYRTWCDSTLGEQVHLTSCYYRFEPYVFLEAAPAAAPAPADAYNGAVSPPVQSSPPGPPPTPNGSHTGSKIPIIAASVSVASFIALLALCVILVWRYKANKKAGKVAINRVGKGPSWPRSLMPTKAKVFSLKELEEATSRQ